MELFFENELCEITNTHIKRPSEDFREITEVEMAKLVKIWLDSNLAKRFVEAKISQFKDPALAPARTFTEYYWKSVLQYL